jgi:uncharacterized protein YndB with AHSA1/START domain
MPNATNTVTIARPPDVVFAFVSDGLNAPKWRSGVLDIALVAGSGVGAAWKQGVKGPGGRRIDADYIVTSYEPERRLAFRATAGPVRPTGDFTLEAVPEGTKLTFSLDVELTGIKKLLMGGQVQKTMDAEVAALARLKEVVEQSG